MTGACQSLPVRAMAGAECVQIDCSSRSRYGSAPNRVVDGIPHGMKWQDNTAGKLPDWLTLTWPKPVQARRVVVYTDSIRALEVQIPGPREGAWVTIGSGAAAQGNAIEAQLAIVETKSIRILVTKLRRDEKLSRVFEVEVYGE